MANHRCKDHFLLILWVLLVLKKYGVVCIVERLASFSEIFLNGPLSMTTRSNLSISDMSSGICAAVRSRCQSPSVGDSPASWKIRLANISTYRPG